MNYLLRELFTPLFRKKGLSSTLFHEWPPAFQFWIVMYERSYWVGVSFRVNTVSIGYAIVDVCANVKGPQNFFEGFSTKFG